MSKISYLFGLFVIVVLFSQCATKKATTSTTTTTSTKSETTPTDHTAKLAEIRKTFTDKDFADGKTIMQTSCNRCHSIFQPEAITIAKWEHVLPVMLKRSKLSQSQSARVRAYILTNAKDS